MFKPSCALFGLIVLGAFYFALRALFSGNSPIAIGSAGHSTVLPGHSTFVFTNTSARQIICRVSRPQFRCNGAWAKFVPSAEAVWKPGRPLFVIPPETLAAGATGTGCVATPMHITAPQGATDWRVGVVWSYAGPTRFQRLKSQVFGFITRGSARLDRVAYTNFSAAITL